MKRRGAEPATGIPFLLLERRDRSPRGSEILAELAHRYTVIQVRSSQGQAYRVGIGDVDGSTNPADQLVLALDQLDKSWPSYFVKPRLLR